MHSTLSFVCGMSFSLALAKLGGEWDWPWWIVLLPVNLFLLFGITFGMVWLICSQAWDDDYEL